MKTTVFKNNRTQSVRIPKEIAFDESVTTLEITRDGDVITLRPAFRDCKDWLTRGTRLADDFVYEPVAGALRDVEL
jgi:antitoxin VapB